jgi:hypothetical protein
VTFDKEKTELKIAVLKAATPPPAKATGGRKKKEE